MFTLPELYYIWSINATLLHGAGNRFCETFCKDAGDDFLFGWMLYHAGDCFCGSELRFGRDFGDFFVECAAENAGKCECVVDLIGKIRASRSNNASARLKRFVWHDFGNWVFERKDDSICRHSFDHFRSNSTWS